MQSRKPIEKSRAEEMRARRKNDNQKELGKKPLKSQFVPAMIPPVLVRNDFYGTPIIHRTRANTKRKFVISLNSLGAEMLFPAVPVIKPGWRLLSGLLTILFGSLLLIAVMTSEFNVNQVEVKGLKRLTASDIETALQLTDLRIFMVNPEKIKSDLEDAFPEFVEISVGVELTSKILVSVSERQPVLEWRYDDLAVWIDQDGVIFPPRGDAGPLLTIHANSAPPLLSNNPPPPVEEFKKAQLKEIPIEDNKNTKKLVDPLLVSTALSLNSQMPPDTPLVFHESSGLGWSDPKGWNIYIGLDLNNLDQKMVVYHGIEQYLINKGILPSMISVEHVHAPFYRLE